MIPFLKIRSEILQLVREDIVMSYALNQIYYLIMNRVKLQDVCDNSNFINFRKLHSIFRNKNKKRRLDVLGFVKGDLL